MINRIVKMTFHPDKVETFKGIFESSKEKIRSFAGCHYLALHQDINSPNIFFTYSKWESESHLNAYRESELFKTTWQNTKILFEAKPEAWSISNLHELV